MNKALVTIFLVLINLTAFGQAVEVSIDTFSNGDFQLLRGGSPYFIKGAAYSGHFLDSLPVYGGNSIRTYQTDSTTIDILNKADSLGITVSLGLYVKHEEHGFNYNDTTAVKEQLEDFRYWVNQYKNHPAVLMWSIGNEADARYTNYRLWNAVNDIAEMIHDEDPLHPTMTVLAGAHDVDIEEINSRAPDIDVLGVNVYKNLYNLETQLTSNGWTRPYIVTEWGVDGTWENLNTNRTEWLAPIELSSTSKAYIYRTRYSDYIEGESSGQILGSYAFVWGHQNHGQVESWFSMFNVLGESTEVVEAMQYKWTGSYPAERAPRITDMKLNGLEADDDITLYEGAVNSAYVTAYDPNSDSLTYEWAIVEEGYKLKDAISGNSFPELAGLITQTSNNTVEFNTPTEKGAYRLYVVVHDGNSKIALEGIPFQVEDNTILRNYNGISVLSYESVIGGYHNGSVNPDVSGVNQTSGVGKFVADGTNSYAKLVFSSPTAIEDAGLFKSGNYKIKMEVRTNAPVGTDIQLNFENEANYGSYPNGRNSTYKITTTVQNEWETLSFNYNSTPDSSILDSEVDQFTFTFDPGNNSSYTYYFDNMRIEMLPEESGGGTSSFLPEPWENSDVGAVGVFGYASATTNGSLFTVKGSGINIWGDSDEFQYVYQPFSGDGEIICMIQSISPDINDYVKTGLMFRETLDDDSKNVLIYTTPESGNAFQYRESTASSTSKVSDASSIDRWLKLKRTGNVFEGYQSNDGTTWSLVSSQTITMADDIYIGLSVTSLDHSRAATAKFRNVSVVSSGSKAQNNKTLSMATSLRKNVKVFPNPVTNHLYLKSFNANIFGVQVYDFKGRQLFENLKIQDKITTVDMSGLPQGLFVLKVEFEDNKYINQLIVKE